MAKRSAEGGRSSPEIAYRFIRCAELVGNSVVREKHWSRNEAIQVCAKLCPSSAFAALSRWRDRDVGWFERQLPALAREVVHSKIIEPLVGWSLSAFSWDYGFDEFVALCIETESEKTRRQYILDTAVRYLRLNEASENTWHNLKKISEKFSLQNKEIQQVLDFYAEHPQRSDREEASQIAEIDEREESNIIDWEKVFGDRQLTTSREISAAFDRFNTLYQWRSHKVFWQELLKKIPESQARELLVAIINAEKVNLYNIKEALRYFPARYSQRISVKRSWNHVLSSIGRRFASELTNSYVRQNFIENIKADGSVLPLILENVIKGLSESCNLVDTSTLFGFAEIVSSFISPQEAGNLLEFALSRFEIHIIDQDYADGHWDNWLLPPDNISEAFTGFIWAALGSPRSAVRWQAAHCVRRLAEAGCDREIDGLIEWMKRDCVNAFGSQVFPFYNLHARLYLSIALARIAIDSPEKLRRHHSVFAHHALDGLPHVLIQKFAADVALSIEAAFPETYDSGVTEKLRQVGISQIPVKEIDGYRENFEETPWHTRGEIDLNLKLYFGWDFEHYWFESLGRVFGIPGNQVEELAREVVVKEWNIKIEDEFIHDLRKNLWDSRRHEGETGNSHGDYPRTDDYSFYLSYHAMFSVAAKLLKEMPIVHKKIGMKRIGLRGYNDIA